MTNLTTEEMQRIVDGAPRKDWTHYCKRNRQYFKRDGNSDRLFVWLGGTKEWSVPIEDKMRWLDRRANLETILAQQQEIERLCDAIIKINDAGTHGRCENAITDAVNLTCEKRCSVERSKEKTSELGKAVEDALYGTVIDDYGNRDDDGLMRIMPNNWAVKLLSKRLEEQDHE